MKKILCLSLLTLSVSAFAFVPEVECELRQPERTILIEIEQPFPNSSIYRHAKVTVVKDGKESVEESTVTARMPRGFKEINYTGIDLNLNVDLWPDSIPRWGRTYKGTVYSSTILGNQRIYDLECRYPFAQ